MPPLPSRARQEFEAELARDVGRVNGSARRQILELLGFPPRIENLTPEAWDLLAGEYREALGLPLERIYAAAIDLMVADIGVGMDAALVNTWASEWASRYIYDLVTGINDTSRRLLQQHVSAFYDRPMSLRELRERIGQTYSPVRAEMIAATEVTRAQSEGEQAYARDLQRQGLELRPFWASNRVDCELCQERVDAADRGEPITDGVYPPLHPRCDCWVRYEVVEKVTP